MQNILFALNTVFPVFCIVLVGVVLRKIKLIDENFIIKSSKIVFNIAFPSLIFFSISQTDFSNYKDFFEAPFGCIGILLSFLFAYLISFFISDKRLRGTFVQGSFRGNYAIIGLALMANLFGQAGVFKGAVILSFTLPVFNILAIIGLIIPYYGISLLSLQKILIRILLNPNIIAILAALPFSYFKVPINDTILKTLDTLSSLALPLALLGVGGSLTFSGIKSNYKISLTAAFIKIVISPIFFTFTAFFLGFTGQSLIAIFLLFAVPTAVTSYIFARELDGDPNLATNILLITTIGSVLTISIGIYIFKAIGIIN